MKQTGTLFTCDRCRKTDTANASDFPVGWGEFDICPGVGPMYVVDLCPVCAKEYVYMQRAFLMQMKNQDVPKEFMETVGGVETELNTTDI